MEKKYLGKITHVSFGLGGYQDVQFGLYVTLEGQGIGTNAFIGGAWDYSFMKDPGENARWTEEDRTKIMIEMLRKISEEAEDKAAKGEPINSSLISAVLAAVMKKDW